MKTKPLRFTHKRWHKIQQRREQRASEILMCSLLREIFIEEAFDKSIEDCMDKEERGEIVLTPEDEDALEKSRIKLMASLKYHREEGVFQKPLYAAH